ncbi:MAG: hypothetical protein U1F77_19910 [Kiritimatiellia bacterium]
MRVATDMQASNLGDGGRLLREHRPDPGLSTTGGVDRLYWDFTWTIQTSGTFRIMAHMDSNGVTNTVEAGDAINITVKFVQRVPPDAVDLDDDDDGLLDLSETTSRGRRPPLIRTPGPIRKSTTNGPSVAHRRWGPTATWTACPTDWNWVTGPRATPRRRT